MRLLIAGQKRFGRAVLELAIKRGHKVVAVSCPDLETDALRIGALNHRLAVLPGRLTAAMVPTGLDLIVAAHCHTFLSAKTRQRAELGALGYHPSLLPRHRGRSAIEWAIRMGEKVTGGSVYWLNDVVDGGPVAAQDWCFIRPDDTAGELWSRELFPMGLRLFARAFAHLEAGVVVAEPQDQSLATWEPAVANVPALWRPDVPMLGSSRFQIVPDRRATLPGQEVAARCPSRHGSAASAGWHSAPSSGRVFQRAGATCSSRSSSRSGREEGGGSRSICRLPPLRPPNSTVMNSRLHRAGHPAG